MQTNKLPQQIKSKGYSFERLVMREILAACDNDTPVDRKTIIRQAYDKYVQKMGKKPSNPGGFFRCLGLVLPVLQRYNPFGFGQWFKSTGLSRYLSEVSGPAPDRYRITFDAILDAKSQKTLLTLPDLFYEQTTKRIRGTPGPFTVADLQAARQSKATFFHVIAELDAWGGRQWHLLRSLVPIPEVGEDYKPASRTIKRPIKDKDTATQTVAMVWRGSKRRQVKDIMTRIDIPSGGLFVEPFAGSATISLMLKAARPDVRLWINDANSGLYAFHKTLRDNPDFMIHKLHTDLPSEKRWQEHKEKLFYETGECLAWSFFYVVYYSFAQRGKNFDPICSCKKELQERKFRNSHRLLQGAKITNVDFREVLRAKGFLYLDPPYYSDENCLYHPFSDKDHFDLYNALNKRDNWLLSYHNHQALRLYEQGHQVESVRVRRSAGVNGTRNDSEFLIYPRIP